MANKYSTADYIFQFITVTAGVLIALVINGLDDWQNDRELVVKARTMIAREVADNLKELEGLSASIESSRKQVDNAMRMANDLLSSGTTSINSVTLQFNLATLNQSSWQTADRTGALAQMDYEAVKRYSELYALQSLFEEHQRKAVDLVSTAIGLLSGAMDPTQASKQDLARFREHLMMVLANLRVTENLGGQLLVAYHKFQP